MYCSISCSRACRSPCSWYRRRRTLSFSAMTVHLLQQPHAVALDLHVVHDRPPDAAQAQLVVVLAPFELCDDVDWPDGRLERAVAERHRDGHLTVSPCAVEDRRERELEVLERLDRQPEAHGEAAEDEVSDAVELALVRKDECDLVGLWHPVQVCTCRSSSSRSACRRREASLPRSTASLQLRLVRSVAAPCDTPVASPASFCTGVLTAKLTVRTAWSIASTASTAL